MLQVLVASAKGGVGKTTISTTLAGALAHQGRAVVLVDADPQGSSLGWVARRDAPQAPVYGVDACRRNWRSRVPVQADAVIIDAPAGAMPRQLTPFLDSADAVIVPVLPSVLDLEATVRFLNALAEVPRVADGSLAVGLVANRLRPWTQASQQVVGQLSGWPCELVAQLRDTQAYVLLAGLGKCLFDYASESIRSHQQDWQPLLHWLEQARA